MRRAIFCILTTGPDATKARRQAELSRMKRRAEELEPREKDLKERMQEDVALVLGGGGGVRRLRPISRQ